MFWRKKNVDILYANKFMLLSGYKVFYVSLIVTTKQKPIVNTQRIKRKNYNQTTKEKVIKPQRKRARKEERNRVTTKTAR